MTACQGVCDAASDCAPCDALDNSFRRIDATRRGYVEGLDETGRRYATLHGRPLKGLDLIEEREPELTLIPADWTGRILRDED